MVELAIVNAYDESTLASVDVDDGDTAQQKLVTAQSYWEQKSLHLSLEQKLIALTKIQSAIQQQSEQLALLIASTSGKPLQDARIEVSRAVQGVAFVIAELPVLLERRAITIGSPAVADNYQTYRYYEPIGVVLVVSAFNHPLNLLIHQVIPALAVGCAVVVKPALVTANIAQQLLTIIHRAGFAKDSCQLCLCCNETTAQLAASERINFLSFIGSSAVGWQLKSRLANGVRCALEHGGVASVIVDETAQQATTITALLKGGFYHAGQVCVSVQKIFVAASIAENFIADLVAATADLIVGNPQCEKTEVGPLISPQAVNRVADWVAAAIKEGAKLLIGGKKLSNTVYAPTILLNPSPQSKVSLQEVFGPVICVYTYCDVNAVIAEINSLPFAFHAAIFSSNLTRAHRWAEQIETSAVMINEHSAFRVDDMLFGGRKYSGYGVGGITHTLQDMVQYKLIVERKMS